MPLLRRRKVGFGVNIGIGSLLADRDRELREQQALEAEQEAEQARQEAEQKAAEREAEAKRSRQYQAYFEDFKNGIATYETTIASLKQAAKSEKNDELKQMLQSAIGAVELVKTNRDIDSKVQDYNSGKISFGELQEYLGNVKSDNDLVKGRVSKILVDARSTENSRIMQRGADEYTAGNITIDQYIQQLTELKNGQTSPTDVQKIDEAMQNALVAKQQLNDQKVYSQWQTGQISDGEAIAYFQAREATSRTPEDAKNIATALSNITKTVQGKGSASAEAYDRQINEARSANKKAYEENILKPQIQVCDGDSACIMRAYDGYGQFLSGQAALGGSQAMAYKGLASQVGVWAVYAASVAENTKLNSQIDALREQLPDPTKEPELYAALQGRIAALAQRGMESQYQTTQQKTDFSKIKERTAVELIAGELALQKQVEEASSVSDEQILSAYNQVKGLPANMLEQFKKDTGLLLDGSASDKAAFANWVAQSPADRANQIFNVIESGKSQQTGKPSDASDATRDSFVKDITDAARTVDTTNATRAKLIDGYLTIVNPGITDAEKREIIGAIYDREGSGRDSLDLLLDSKEILETMRIESGRETLRGTRYIAPTPQDPLETNDFSSAVREAARVQKKEEAAMAISEASGPAKELPEPYGSPSPKELMDNLGTTIGDILGGLSGLFQPTTEKPEQRGVTQVPGQEATMSTPSQPVNPYRQEYTLPELPEFEGTSSLPATSNVNPFRETDTPTFEPTPEPAPQTNVESGQDVPTFEPYYPTPSYPTPTSSGGPF